MVEPTPHEVMTRYAEDAISYAKECHAIDLDYSLGSLVSIQSIVEKLYTDRPTGLLARALGQTPKPDELKIMSLILGGYAGEVYRRAKGGEWRIEEDSGGCGVVTNGVWIFPVQQVHTQLSTGEKSDYVMPLSPSQLTK
jgi:hypothetical protein